MSPESQGVQPKPYTHLLHRAMAFLAVLVVVRFEFELVGLPHDLARFISATTGVLFVAIYIAAVGPLRGCLQKFSQLPLAALILSAWTEAWIILATVISAVFHLGRSHFAEKEDFGNLGHLGRHVLGHVIETGVFFVMMLLLMAIVHILWRWPVTVGPGAMLGVFVIMRYWTEAMGLEPLRTAAWSSTILVLLSAFYLGGVGPLLGLTKTRQLLVPSMVLGWAWQLWIYLAKVFAAFVPFFKTHFFDPSQGHVPLRLLGALGQGIIEGFIAGLLVWGIATWIACATQGGSTASPSNTESSN